MGSDQTAIGELAPCDGFLLPCRKLGASQTIASLFRCRSSCSPDPDIGVEVAPIFGWRHNTGADDEIAKMLAGLAFGRIGPKQRIEPRHDCGMIHVLGIELGKSRAVECSAEI